MTKAHIILHRYIRGQFIPGSVDMKDIGEDKVLLTDRTGASMTLTMNLYCDVMDAETRQIYAVSNLPHDLALVGNQLPTKWTEKLR